MTKDEAIEWFYNHDAEWQNDQYNEFNALLDGDEDKFVYAVAKAYGYKIVD